MNELNQQSTDSLPEEEPPMRPKKKKKNKKRNRKWISALDEVEIGPFLFVPLTCTKDLKDEGYAMEHCVGTYLNCCRGDWMRVFSVRDAFDGKRVATLSLMFEYERWNLEEIKGFRNKDVISQESTYYDGEQVVTELSLSDLHYAAMELLEMYRRAMSPHAVEMSAWSSIHFSAIE